MDMKNISVIKKTALFAAVLSCVFMTANVSAQENPAKAPVVVSAPEAGKQVAQTCKKEITKDVSLDYLLFLPQSYTKADDTKFPVLIFLHGVGERGASINDLNIVKTHGPAKLVEKDPNFPFIVVSPQCPITSWWADDMDPLNALLDHILATIPNADPDRVYLTGLSMGGAGTFSWAMRNPERFAAAAPVCGCGEYRHYYGLNHEKMTALRNLPFWFFHGESDTVIPPERSKDPADGLKSVGVREVKRTTYPGVGHNSWEQAYSDPELYKWFLSHDRKKNALSAKNK